MDWFEHPAFRRTRDDVVARLRRDAYRFRRLPPVVFLCGARNSLRRDRLAAYLRGRADVLVFYAEDVWNVIAAQRPQDNALAMENELASLADIVVVVVESPGTFAELGAFALSEPLRAKLLPILDLAFQGQNSFLETGPVRWVDEASDYRPSIWIPHDPILQAAGEVEERLRRIPPRRVSELVDLAASPKHLVFFLADLVAIFGPCCDSLVERLSKIIVGSPLQRDVGLLLALGVGMDILSSLEVDGTPYYYRPLEDGQLRSFHRTRKFADVPSLRAEVLSTMLSMPESRELLQHLEGAHDAA